MEEKSLARVRRGEAEWRRIVVRQAESGLSVSRFCEREGILEGCFYRWRRRFQETASTARFVELSPRLLSRGGIRAELELEDGVILRVYR
jgi:transposase-like protein